jgi:hypothetical protein
MVFNISRNQSENKRNLHHKPMVAFPTHEKKEVIALTPEMELHQM